MTFLSPLQRVLDTLEADLSARISSGTLSDLLDNQCRLPLTHLDHPFFRQHDVLVSVLRADALHPQLSGNKWFKLKYHLAQALQSGVETLVSMGGAWSNHLHALAWIANALQINSVGIVRGEELTPNSNAMLRDVSRLGMALTFVSRRQYRNWCQQPEKVDVAAGRRVYVIPEGGDSWLGALGAASMLKSVAWDLKGISHLFSAVGTGCTFAGLRMMAPASVQCIGISALKGDWVVRAMTERFADYWRLLEKEDLRERDFPGRWQIETNYHCGGFGRVDQNLLGFMQQFRDNTGMELEPVYTGKAMMALFDMMTQNRIAPGSHVVFVHSGGLQGNRGFEISGF